MFPNFGGVKFSLKEDNSAVTFLQGDILMSNIRPYLRKIWYSNSSGGCSSDILVFRVKETFDSKYIFYKLSSDTFIDYVAAGAKGTKMPRGDKKQILKFPIFFSNLEEQTKIASFLSLIDERIQTQMKIIEEWEKLKKGLQEQIFLQKLRFKDENGKAFVSWKEKKLGEIATITTGKLDANAMVKNGKFRFYTCAKEFFYINKYAFDTEALLISGNGANVGYIHHYKGKFNAYQRTYVLYSIEENILYLKYYLEQFLFQRILLEKRDGNTPYIVLSTLSEMNILFPCLKEQSNIANFLSSIDNKINLEKSLLSAYQEQKKYLLQNLFI